MYSEQELLQLIAGVMYPKAQKVVTFNAGSGSGALVAAAALSTALTGANNDLDITAATTGSAGNSISLSYIDPGVNGAALKLTVYGTDIIVTLATGNLTAASTVLTSDNTNIADADTVTIGTTVYRFKDTLAQIGDVKRGASADASLLSLAKTLNGTGVAGTDMFAGTPADPNVSSSATVTSHTITLTALVKGTAANSTATTTTASDLSFTGTTLAGGVNKDTITSTAGQIATAIAADPIASTLVTTANHSGNDGTGVVTAMAKSLLTGGKDVAINLFKVSGSVLVALRGYVQTTPTGTNGTLVHGIAATTNLLITILTATSMTARKGIDSTGIVSQGVALAKTPLMLLNDGENIIATPATTAIATGKILYICDWIPLTPNASVTPL